MIYKKRDYISISEFSAKCDEYLGALPEKWQPWKSVNFSKNKEELLKAYFAAIKGMDTVGAQLAKVCHNRSAQIGKQLVNSGVANSDEDVNTVC